MGMDRDMEKKAESKDLAFYRGRGLAFSFPCKPFEPHQEEKNKKAGKDGVLP